MPRGSGTGTMTYPCSFPGARRMQRPTIWITSVGLRRGAKSATASRLGLSVPSPKIPTFAIPRGFSPSAPARSRSARRRSRTGCPASRCSTAYGRATPSTPPSAKYRSISERPSSLVSHFTIWSERWTLFRNASDRLTRNLPSSPTAPPASVTP